MMLRMLARRVEHMVALQIKSMEIIIVRCLQSHFVQQHWKYGGIFRLYILHIKSATLKIKKVCTLHM